MPRRNEVVPVGDLDRVAHLAGQQRFLRLRCCPAGRLPAGDSRGGVATNRMSPGVGYRLHFGCCGEVGQLVGWCLGCEIKSIMGHAASGSLKEAGSGGA